MFYFHIQNGAATLDLDGFDLTDIEAARSEAVALVAGMLRDGKACDLLNNYPLRVWVTDQPNGEGKTLFALNVTVQT